MINLMKLANCTSDFHVRGRKMFQNVPESCVVLPLYCFAKLEAIVCIKICHV